MRLAFTASGWADYVSWQRDDPKLLARINLLLEDIRRSPFKGLGKPEPLRQNLAGHWSRRIDAEHRLVYRLIGKGDDQQIEIVHCRLHYGNA